MKRIQVRPGKFVSVSDDLAEKAARVLASTGIPREVVERTAKAEPRGTTIYAGKTSRGLRTVRRP